jgi:hypothetical protein
MRGSPSEPQAQELQAIHTSLAAGAGGQWQRARQSSTARRWAGTHRASRRTCPPPPSPAASERCITATSSSVSGPSTACFTARSRRPAASAAALASGRPLLRFFTRMCTWRGRGAGAGRGGCGEGARQGAQGG